jgi:hypothetical protein
MPPPSPRSTIGFGPFTQEFEAAHGRREIAVVVVGLPLAESENATAVPRSGSRAGRYSSGTTMAVRGRDRRMAAAHP